VQPGTAQQCVQQRRHVNHTQTRTGVPAGSIGVEQRPRDPCCGVLSVAEVHDHHRRAAGDHQIDQRVAHPGHALVVEPAAHRGYQAARPGRVRTDADATGIMQRLRGCGCRRLGEVVAQLCDGTVQQPRDAHLGGVQLRGDLRLGPVAEEVALDDLAFPLRQPVDGGTHGQPVAQGLDRAVLASEQILLFDGVGVATGRPVERIGSVGRRTGLGGTDLRLRDAHGRRDLRRGRGVVQMLLQLRPGPGYLQAPFLQPPRDVHGPDPVTKVPLEFSEDGRRGISGEATAPLGIIAVGGLDQGQRGDLHQVVQRLAAMLVARRQSVRQGQVPPDHLIAQPTAFLGRAARAAHPADGLDGRPVALIGARTALLVHARRSRRDTTGVQQKGHGDSRKGAERRKALAVARAAVTGR
jgi:hypothetical protein